MCVSICTYVRTICTEASCPLHACILQLVTGGKKYKTTNELSTLAARQRAYIVLTFIYDKCEGNILIGFAIIIKNKRVRGDFLSIPRTSDWGCYRLNLLTYISAGVECCRMTMRIVL